MSVQGDPSFKTWIATWWAPLAVGVVVLVGGAFLTSIQSQLTTVQGDVSSLGTRVDQTNATLGTRLDQMTARIDAGVDATAKRIDALITGVAEVKAIVTSVANDTSNLRQRADEAEREMNKLSDRVFYTNLRGLVGGAGMLGDGPGGLSATVHEGEIFIFPKSAEDRKKVESVGLQLKKLPSGIEGYVVPASALKQ